MWVLRRVSRLLALGAVLIGAVPDGRVLAEVLPPPARVVSINLCTDQLAMLLAAPGQLVSVTYLARDPRSSAMPEAALAWPVNRARAEDIYLLNPDLVLAGSFSPPATLAMLERLGIRVERFAPVSSFDEVVAQMHAVGAALGREAEAAAMARDFEDALAALAEDVARRPRAALYSANGYTGGTRTLAGQVLDFAGFANIAAELGMAHGGFLPLEAVVMAQPDLLVTGTPYPGASRGEEMLDHPALAPLRAATGGARLADSDWVCGTPHLLNAVVRLLDARHMLEAAP